MWMLLGSLTGFTKIEVVANGTVESGSDYWLGVAAVAGVAGPDMRGFGFRFWWRLS